MAQYKVPDKYDNYSIRDIHNDLLKGGLRTGLGSTGTVAGFLGIGETDRLKAGQILNYNAPAQYANSSEATGIARAFGNPYDASAVNAQKAQDFNQRQRVILDDYLGRLGGVPEELDAVYNALGIPQAYQERDIIGQTIRDLPGSINTGSKGELTSSQIAGRTARDIADITPALQSSQANVQSLVEQYGVKTSQIFKPFEIEAGLLGDQAKNEYDLLKTNITADLNRELAQLDRQTKLDTNEMNRLISMAEIEAGKGNLVDLGDRVVYVIDGKEISSFGKGKLSSSDGGNGNISDYLNGSVIIKNNPSPTPGFTPLNNSSNSSSNFTVDPSFYTLSDK